MAEDNEEEFNFWEPKLERILYDEDKEEATNGAPLLYCNNLMNLMNECRKKSSFCDVKLIVENVEFPAHKMVLASASQFFNGLFNAEMKEKQQDTIVLKEVKALAMENLLEYIYTGKTEINTRNAYELVKISNYFLVDGLKDEASSFIGFCLHLDNALLLKVFADEHSCQSLKEQCNQLIRAYFEDHFIEDLGFYEFEFEDIEEFIANESTVVHKEETMFKTVKRWVMESPSTRKKHFKSLFRHIRLQHISKNYLNNVILKDELVTGNVSCMQFVLQSLSMMDSLPPLLRPRKSVDDRYDTIVIIGGFDADNSPTSSTMCFAPDSQRDEAWRVLTPLSKARYASTSAFCGGFLYAIGGWQSGAEEYSSDNAVTTVERYDPTTNTWLNVAPLPDEPEKWVTATTLDGSIYILCTSNKLFCYNPTQNHWDCLPSKPSNEGELHGANLVACSNNIYVIGGLDANSSTPIVLSRLLKFDPEVQKWSLLSPMTVQRYLASAVVKENKIYVMGGLKDYASNAMGQALGSCEVYTIENEAWQMLPNLQYPRYAAGLACMWDEIYILGGEHKGETQDNIEYFNEKEKRWEVVSSMPCRSYFTCHWVRMPASISWLDIIKPESFAEY